MSLDYALSLFNYSRITPNMREVVQDMPLGGLYKYMMKPYAPLVGVALYLSMIKTWEARNQRVAAMAGGSVRNKTGNGLKSLIILHNLVLAGYSLWTFIDFFPAVVDNVLQHGFKDGFCDSSQTLWSNKLLTHGFLFYLSKYYEFIDTAIILAKGRKAGRLQSFHHSGAVLIMWFGNYVQSPYLSFFVFENSIIHSLMYVYYTLTALGFSPPGKKLLTSMQISQFYIALSAGIIYCVLPECQDVSQKVFTYVFIGYIIELIRLFTQFARQTYGAKNQQKQAETKNTKTE